MVLWFHTFINRFISYSSRFSSRNPTAVFLEIFKILASRIIIPRTFFFCSRLIRDVNGISPTCPNRFLYLIEVSVNVAIYLVLKRVYAYNNKMPIKIEVIKAGTSLLKMRFITTGKATRLILKTIGFTFGASFAKAK